MFDSLAKSGIFKDIIGSLVIIIIISIILTEFINIISPFSIILLIIKVSFGISKINGLNNYSDSFFTNISANIYDILENTKNKENVLINALKNYLPVIILNGLLMITLYVIFTTKLRVELSLASNCAKSNYTVEYTTLRKKINDFARNNDEMLKSYLIILIICFILALLVIFYILYNDIIEIQYVMIIPILIFLIIFASMIIDRIDKNNFDNHFDQDETLKKAKSFKQAIEFSKFLALPFIGLFGVSLLIV
tara:strand:- start:4777 stop:5529 length:753 start_codon:yes stop_codon:yes gene_type:complete